MSTLAVQASGVTPPTSVAAGMAVETRGLTRRFGRRLAVDGVDLRVEQGKTYGLIGLNGAGKSTLLRMVVGLLAPSAGNVLVRGCDIAEEPIDFRRRLGYVPDRPAAYGWMRVGEVLAFAKRLRREWSDETAKALVARYRLDVRQRVGKLSKGQGAKLSLLLAMAFDPEILVLDEPTDGLDPVARDEFLEEVVGTVADRERTVIISSHALTDVQKLADVIGLMHNGKLVLQCPTEELVQTTKRMRAVVADGATLTPPNGAICSRQVGREWVVTVRGFTPEAVEAVRVSAGGGEVRVEDLALEEVFKDFVRGQETAR